MKIKRLVYISNPIESAVVESQVYALLQYYKYSNAFEKIILVQVCNNKVSYFRASTLLKKYDFEVIYVYGSISILLKINPFYFRLKKIIRGLIEDDDFFIHARTELIGYYALCALNSLKSPLNILIDVRGVYKEELEYRIFKGDYKSIFNHVIIMFFLYQRIFKVFNNYNISFSAVSQTLKVYLENNGLKAKIYVNSNIVSEDFAFRAKDRIALRKELGISEDKLVVVLSTSGNDSWQFDKSVVNCFLNDDRFVVLNLSKEKIGDKKVINMYLPFHEMPRFLSASDIAIVWREKNLLNACASPSKFSEFAAMGLYVIHNNSVDLISDYIVRYNHGILLEEVNYCDFSIFSNIKSNNRSSLSKLGRKSFGVEIISKRYKDLYNEIKCSNQL
jgi:hypothetical protein